MATMHPLIEILHFVSQAVQDLMSTNLKDLPSAYAQWWLSLYHSSPTHVFVETGLLLFILWLWFIRPTINPEKATRGSTVKLSKAEVDELIEDWEPEPLVPDLDEDQQALADSSKIIESYDGSYVTVRGYPKKALNLASFDFLGMSNHAPVKEASEQALNKYGCGSCGPRGFYGTIDVHLHFEEAMAKFMHSEEAIAYSDGPSTVSSAIPAFAKRGDVLLVDECVNEAIRTGVNLSRSHIHVFRHNDVAHLESIMKDLAAGDKRKKRKKDEVRRFVIVEGLYRNKGTVAPLPEIVALKNKYCYRLILDESYSFGVMGANGRGALEHFNIDRKEAEILTLSMENSLGSVGGVCVGSHTVVDHQRLSGAGYCFSASTPPFLSVAALTALERLQNNTDVIRKLESNTRKMFSKLNSRSSGIVMESNGESPIVTFRPTNTESLTRKEQLRVMEQWADACLQNGLFLAVNRFDGNDIPTVDANALHPTLRLTVTADLTDAQIESAAQIVLTTRKALQL